MIGLGQIDQLEVEAEGAGQLIGRQRIVGVLVDTEERLLKLAAGRSIGVARLLRLAATDSGAAKVFDRIEEGCPGLLAQHIAQ